MSKGTDRPDTAHHAPRPFGIDGEVDAAGHVRTRQVQLQRRQPGFPADLLACFTHWTMLPTDLRASIRYHYRAKSWRTYAEQVRKADALWQAAGIWKPGVAKTS